MKLAVLVEPPPWPARTRYYLNRLHAQQPLAAILVVARPRRSQSRAQFLRRKFGSLGALPALAAAAWFRRYSRQIDALQDRHFAERAGSESPVVPTIHFDDLNGPQTLAWIERERPDVIVPIAGGIIKPQLLAATRWVRWHHGITPDIRGASATYWAIYHHRPAWLGITIQELVAKIDAGPILAQRVLTPTGDDDLASVYVKLDELCIELLCETLAGLAAGTLQPRPCDPKQGQYLSSPTLTSLLGFERRQRAFFRQFAAISPR
ncbi:MAG: hypothetical protein K1X74_01200 [Pirellulales bacterium]|nr:hypothetical protein [Pirellulales bacterium]